jgi:hypothetical protein
MPSASSWRRGQRFRSCRANRDQNTVLTWELWAAGRAADFRIVRPPTGILPRSCGSVARRPWQLTVARTHRPNLHLRTNGVCAKLYTGAFASRTPAQRARERSSRLEQRAVPSAEEIRRKPHRDSDARRCRAAKGICSRGFWLVRLFSWWRVGAHEPRPGPPASGDGSWRASDEPGGKVFLADGCRGGCSVRFDRAVARPNYAAR